MSRSVGRAVATYVLVLATIASGPLANCCPPAFTGDEPVLACCVMTCSDVDRLPPPSAEFVGKGQFVQPAQTPAEREPRPHLVAVRGGSPDAASIHVAPSVVTIQLRI